MSSQYHQVVVQQTPTNGLGTAGFIVSLLSFFLCGLSSPIGLILSCLGMLFPPRGMAFAGVVLGAIGSAWLFVFGLAMLAGILGMIGLANAPPPADAPSIEAPAEDMSVPSAVEK